MQGKTELVYINLAFEVAAMYRKTERQLPLENFYLPFRGELDPENRWVKLAKLTPGASLKRNMPFIRENRKPSP